MSSVEGKGSTFAVEVPLGTVDDVAVKSRGSIKTSEHGDRVVVVLFIDDDPAVVDATSMMLDGIGLDVHTELSGEEALAHITNGVRPSIIVSDYRLLGYNGVEMVRRVRAATVGDLPSVLMIGDTSAKEIELANLENCAVLHKPVDTDRVIDLIGDLTA